MNLTPFSDPLRLFAFWEAWLVSDLAARHLEKQVRTNGLDATALAGTSSEASQLIMDAKDRAEDVLPRRKNNMIVHVTYLAILIYDPDWLENLAAGLERDTQAADNEPLPLKQVQSIELRQKVLAMALSANGNQARRVPRSLPRGIFHLMDQAGMWDYSAVQTDEVIFKPLVAAGWFSRTKGAGQSVTYHATGLFEKAARGVSAFEAPSMPDFAALKPRQEPASKVSLPNLPWETVDVKNKGRAAARIATPFLPLVLALTMLFGTVPEADAGSQVVMPSPTADHLVQAFVVDASVERETMVSGMSDVPPVVLSVPELAGGLLHYAEPDHVTRWNGIAKSAGISVGDTKPFFVSDARGMLDGLGVPRPKLAQ